MKSLHINFNDRHSEDRWYCAKLKSKLIEEFGDQLIFLKASTVAPDMIKRNDKSSSLSLKESYNKESIVVEAAQFLHKDILDYASNLNTDDCPPDLMIL